MRRMIVVGFLAGIVCAAVFAGVDSISLIFGLGGSWLRFGKTLVSVAIYLIPGAVIGGLVGFFLSLIRGARTKNAISVFKVMVIFFTFVALVLFCWLYLYDFGLGQFKRGQTWHYVLALLASLVFSVCTWLILKFLLFFTYRRKKTPIGWAAITFLALVLVAIFLARFAKPGTSGKPVGATVAGSTAPNILLLVMDTTRRDALSCYGNPRETTPHLDRIASEGLRFTRAYAADSWTPPSHASIFSGLYPSQHGTYSNQISLKVGFPTVSEILSEAGYETFFLACKGILRRSLGWNRGFEHCVTANLENKCSLVYERLFDKFIKRSATLTPLTVEIAIRWLECRKRARPFFLFVNLTDPHSPFTPREPFFSQCCSAVNLPDVDKGKIRRLVKSQDSLDMYNKGKIPPLNESELEYLRCLYDSEVNFMDKHIGRLIEKLRRMEDGRKTVAIITSDHGEMLGEHQLMTHGKYLYDELIHVPLIIWGSGETGVINDLVSLTDLFPTFLKLAGSKTGAYPDTGGANLLGSLGNRTLFAESWTRDVYRKAALSAEFKYVWESMGEPYLFELDKDPHELKNLAGVRPELTQALHRELASKLDLSLEPVKPNEIDKSSLKLLKSLGYLH